jgi:DNA end-binding protein Ku
MVQLAGHILDSKAGRFDAKKFKDQHELALRKLVKRKAAGKTIEPPEERSNSSNVIDLMDALRQSVKGKITAALRSKSDSRKSAPARTRKRRIRKAG